MPANIVNTMIDKLNMSKAEAEKLWNKAKAIADSEYKVKNDSPRFFSIVVGILKKMLGGKAKKLGWSYYNKADHLSDVIDYYGKFEYYDIIEQVEMSTGVSMQGENNIMMKAIDMLDKAIEKKNTGFFKKLLQEYVTDLLMKKKTENEIYDMLREKMMKSLYRKGYGLTSEKISNIREVLKLTIANIKKDVERFKKREKL